MTLRRLTALWAASAGLCQAAVLRRSQAEENTTEHWAGTGHPRGSTAGTVRTQLETQPDHDSEFKLKNACMTINFRVSQNTDKTKTSLSMLFGWTDHRKVPSVGFGSICQWDHGLQPTLTLPFCIVTQVIIHERNYNDKRYIQFLPVDPHKLYMLDLMTHCLQYDAWSKRSHPAAADMATQRSPLWRTWHRRTVLCSWWPWGTAHLWICTTRMCQPWHQIYPASPRTGW